MSGDCPKCGGTLIWVGRSWAPLTNRFHVLMRRHLMRAVHHQLYRQKALKAWLDELARDDMVGFRWRNGVYTGWQLEDRWQIPREWWESLGDAGQAETLCAMRIHESELVMARYGIDVNPATWFHRVYTPRETH